MAGWICSSILSVRLSTILDAHAAGIDQFDEAVADGTADSVTRSRVTPAVRSTMASRLPASQLKRLDLPTLGRPTMTTCGTPIGIAHSFTALHLDRVRERQSEDKELHTSGSSS